MNRHLLALILIAWTGSSAAGERCDNLTRYTQGGAAILIAQSMTSEVFRAPDGGTYDGLSPFCRVIARAVPSRESNIIIEIWLPDAASWNGKLLGTGNGAFAGVIRYAALAGGLKRGYATANTDMGTYPAGILGTAGYEAGNGRPQVVKDWGHRSTHEMTLFAKALIEHYYDQRPRRAYFSGCSTGGHQGLAEAQRYPGDYDAILAGAPGHNRTHLHTAFAATFLSARPPGAFVSQAKAALFHNALLKACAGKDGGAPGDAFLTDPVRCELEPRQLLCRSGEDNATCLTTGEVRTLELAYSGNTRNPRTGGLIYPAWVKGSEQILAFFFGAPSSRASQVSTDLSRWVFGSGWNGATFDFDRDMARVDAAIGADVNALNPDLSAFASHGGKLILYHGWADAVVSPLDSILYYDRIVTPHAASRDKRSFVRLFMASGVGHCQGGPGPDTFGQGADTPFDDDPDHDLLVALDRWVEQGVAPESIIARKYSPSPPNSDPIASRPLCAYPSLARYDGRGDPSLASSFRCLPAKPVRYERPALEYLQ